MLINKTSQLIKVINVVSLWGLKKVFLTTKRAAQSDIGVMRLILPVEQTIFLQDI